MILTFKQKRFEQAILSGEKIHTIRADNGRRWKPGRSIQFWLGSPRNVKRNPPPRQFHSGICISVQEIEIFRDETAAHWFRIMVDGRLLPELEATDLARNDGLAPDLFRWWFVPPELPEFRGVLIHWTDFKYQY